MNNKENKRINSIKETLYKDINIELVIFIENVSNTYEILKDIGLDYSNDDLKVLSFILANSGKYESFLQRIIDENKIARKSIDMTTYNYNKRENKNKEANIDIINEQFKEYLTKDATVLSVYEKVLKNATSSDIRKILYECHVELKDIDNLEEKYLNEKRRRKKINDNIYYICGFNREIESYLKRTLRLFETLKEINSEYTEENIMDLSLILSVFVGNNLKEIEILKRNNIDSNKILAKLSLNDCIYNKMPTSADCLLLNDQVRKYFDKAAYKKDKTELEIKDVLYEVFSKRNLDLDTNYEKLLRELQTGKKYEDSLTIEERCALLLNGEMEIYDENNIESVINLGNNLVPHLNYIYEEMPKMLSDNKSISDIRTLVDNVYVKNEVEESKGLFSRIFKNNKSERIEIDTNALKKLKDEINDRIIILNSELVGYDKIRRFMEIYRKRNSEYYEKTKEIVGILEEEIKSLDPDSDKDYDAFLRKRTMLQVMKDKENRFLTANIVAKQELYRLNQMIINHFITINSLTVAKDDLFPLIGAELSIYEGRKTEKESLELSKNVMDLFKSLLSYNVEDANKNMDFLRDNLNNSEIIYKINNDVASVVEKIKESTSFLELDDKTSSSNKKLVLKRK